MLNWGIARGTIPIPKSQTVAHICENMNVFDFTLSEEEMQTIDGMDQNHKICGDKKPFTGYYKFFVWVFYMICKTLIRKTLLRFA